MQNLGKGFKVKRMYVEGGLVLCECPDGWYFGHGPKAKRITRADQIGIENAAVVTEIRAWLDGEAAREQEALTRKASQPAQAQPEPNSLSVLVNALTPEAQEGLAAVIADFLGKQGSATLAPAIGADGLTERPVPGGKLIELPDGGKKFVPEDMEPEQLDVAAKEDEEAGPTAAPAWECIHCKTGYDTKAKRDGHLRWCKARPAHHNLVQA